MEIDYEQRLFPVGVTIPCKPLTYTGQAVEVAAEEPAAVRQRDLGCQNPWKALGRNITRNLRGNAVNGRVTIPPKTEGS